MVLEGKLTGDVDCGDAVNVSMVELLTYVVLETNTPLVKEYEAGTDELLIGVHEGQHGSV